MIILEHRTLFDIYTGCAREKTLATAAFSIELHYQCVSRGLVRKAIMKPETQLSPITTSAPPIPSADEQILLSLEAHLHARHFSHACTLLADHLDMLLDNIPIERLQSLLKFIPVTRQKTCAHFSYFAGIIFMRVGQPDRATAQLHQASTLYLAANQQEFALR
ncbi:MAG: hypothetical protein R2867_04105 [Caldilineaceae bacterium]